jgi:hypothetical protein
MQFLIGLVSTLIRAVVFMLMWSWFIVPLGAPALGYWHALGLVFTYNSLADTIDTDRIQTWLELRDDGVLHAYSLCASAITTATCLLILALGFICRLIMG